jgi:hypothetical protein
VAYLDSPESRFVRSCLFVVTIALANEPCKTRVVFCSQDFAAYIISKILCNTSLTAIGVWYCGGAVALALG